MRKLAVLSAAALVGFGALAANDAEARSRRSSTGAVIAAGVAGAAVGGLIGAAASNASAAPAYRYNYPAYGDGYGYATTPTYRTTRVVRTYDYAPAYRTRRVVRTYDYAPAGYDYGYAPVTTRTVRTVRTYDYAPASSYSWRAPAYGYSGW